MLELLTIGGWNVVPPLISIVFYYRTLYNVHSPARTPLTRLLLAKTLRIFYRQSRDANNSLGRTNSVSRTNYFRILTLASIDLLLTLPVGIVSIALAITSWLHNFPLPFYWGWSYLHTDWEPLSVSYAEFKSSGTANFALYYFNNWTSPILAFITFGLFGLTSEARASYSTLR